MRACSSLHTQRAPAPHGPLAHGLVPAALVALVFTLAGCGGGSTDASDGRADAQAVSQPGELTAFVQERLRRLNAQGQLGTGLKHKRPHVHHPLRAATRRPGVGFHEVVDFQQRHG